MSDDLNFAYVRYCDEELIGFGCRVPGGIIHVESDAALDRAIASTLMRQIELTHRVPLLGDGVKVRFRKAVA